MLFGLFCLTGCKDEVRVIWTEGEADPATGKAIHTLTVVNAPEGTDWKIWLASNYISQSAKEGTGGKIEMHHGCWFVMTPYERTGKDLVVNMFFFLRKGYLTSRIIRSRPRSGI